MNLSLAVFFLSASAVRVVGAVSLRRTDAAAEFKDGVDHQHPTARKLGHDHFGNDDVFSDNHRYRTEVCHYPDVVNGCAGDMYLDICDPNVSNEDPNFSQNRCSCKSEAQCKALLGGGKPMMDMETGIRICVWSEERVCLPAAAEFKTLEVYANFYQRPSNVHYWQCNCIRTEREMANLGTPYARTYRNVDPVESTIRFSKIDYSGEIGGGIFTRSFPNLTDAQIAANEAELPLDMNDYPLTQYPAMAEMVKDSNAISVVLEDDYEIKHNVQDLIKNVTSDLGLTMPPHPTSDSSSPFWDELDHVVEVQITRENNGNLMAKDVIDELMKSIPDLWEGYSVNAVADAVHDEPPGYHQAALIRDLLGGVKYGPLELDYTLFADHQARSAVEFLHGVVMLYDINTWAINYVAPMNFAAKWHIGRARPEEVVWAILNGTIAEADVPTALYDKIVDNFSGNTKAEEFTAYDEGSPRHPSWPAMHSCASNVSFWLQVLFKLTADQLCAAKKIDYSVSFARTVAGVHFERDNIDGLNMGQEIMELGLPYYLHHKYDMHEDALIAKAADKRFNWNLFDPSNPCA